MFHIFKTKLTKSPPLSTSKMVLWGVIFLCLEIVVFCEWAMIYARDLSAMYVLIGIPAALAPTIMSYMYKSRKENTVGGIVYDTAMAQFKTDDSDVNSDEFDMEIEDPVDTLVDSNVEAEG